jgi:hypothetical protein
MKKQQADPAHKKTCLIQRPSEIIEKPKRDASQVVHPVFNATQHPQSYQPMLNCSKKTSCAEDIGT